MTNVYRQRQSSRVMILILAILGLIVSVTPGLAQRGDTARVRAFDNYLWTWNGGQDRWAVFPDSTFRSEKILMHYRLKCPTGGCGQWDYTTNVYILDHTGRIDSSQQRAPSFRVNGGIVDSVQLSTDTTWIYSWNSRARKVDTTASAPLNIVFYRDPLDVWSATDSLLVWPAGYHAYMFSDSGAVIDSAWVAPDSVLYVTTQQVWVRFEVVVPIEIGRLITPYGKWFAKDREFDWVFDVTEYAYLLHDSVEIRTFYDGWSKGSLYTLDFELIEGVPPVDVFRVENLYGGAFAYGNPGDPIETRLPERAVQIDSASEYTRLKIVTTGHGFGGTENAAEFSEKTHHVTVDGTRRFDQHLWRADCGQNPVYPQAGTWYFQRAGWCPGDLVIPNYYNLTSFVSPGDTSRIDYNMQPFVNQDLSHGATYIVQAQVQYATGPNFQNDAEVMEIMTPTDEFKYHRLNPICRNASPVIVIRNRGGAPLTSLRINYLAGTTPMSFAWRGNLAFLETAEVTLPAIDLGSGPGTFTVILLDPNGVADEYASNNVAFARYELPKTYSNIVYLSIRTDDYGDLAPDYNGISYELVDLSGNVLYSGANFADRITHRDTFNLADGCYQFIIRDDVVGDGLLPIQGTSGNYSLRDNKSQTIINAVSAGPLYLASFGDREVTTFTVSSASRVDEQKVGSLEGVRIYPNPSKGAISIDLGPLAGIDGTTLQVSTVLGETILERELTAADPSTILLDLPSRPAGTYIVTIRSGVNVRSEKVAVEK